MWVSPNHPNPPRQPGPPPDEGHELATIRRPDGHEMRLRLKSYQGRPYVSAQLWRDEGGAGAWPVKGRSVTFRMAEIQEVVEGLQSALEAVASGGAQGASHPPRDEAPKFVDRGRPVRAPFDPATMPKLEGGAEEFNEFDEN